MTKALEETFNVDPTPKVTDEKPTEEALPVELESHEITTMADPDLGDVIETALPQVEGLDKDEVYDDIVKKALEGYTQLMDLGNNIDARNAGKVFEVASSFLEKAIAAQTNKDKKKLDVVSHQLRKRAQDLRKIAAGGALPAPEATGKVIQAKMIDRNELLKQFKEQSDQHK